MTSIGNIHHGGALMFWVGRLNCRVSSCVINLTITFGYSVIITLLVYLPAPCIPDIWCILWCESLSADG